MYKISFYVPKTHCDAVKTAMFNAGAGTMGHYRACAWQVLGTGQFMPQKGHQAYQGETGKLETIEEYRVEMMCQISIIKKVIQALKESHPYETPAYDVVACLDV